MKNRKRFFAFSLILVFVFSSFSFISCNSSFNKQMFEAYEFRYFDTQCSVIGYDTDRESFDEIKTLAFSMLKEYHELYDIRNPYEGVNNLYELNRVVDGSHRRLACDGRIIDLLVFSKEAYDLTGGATNVAMGSVLTHWQRAMKEYDDFGYCNLPTEGEIAQALKHTDINAIEIDKENKTVFISDPKVKIDVGAVAKGYATEMIARELEKRGLTGYLLNFGGNVRAVGNKPSGERWAVGIDNPDKDSKNPYLEILSLENEALVTSGSYRRFLVADGVKYHHVIDPKTGYPANYSVSVSVVTPNSALGDVFSTALFCLPIDEALALAEATDGIEALFLDNEGNTYSTSGFSAYKRNS